LFCFFRVPDKTSLSFCTFFKLSENIPFLAWKLIIFKCEIFLRNYLWFRGFWTSKAANFNSSSLNLLPFPFFSLQLEIVAVTHF
jgi:hypothetical protein